MRTPPEDPMSYETSVEESLDGQFEVIVTTIYRDGAQRQQVGVHSTRQRAELAAKLVDRSAKRYVGVGDSRRGAPTFADPELP